MNCPSCKHPNLAERNYCGGCGVSLARYCTLCGFRNLLADRFCGGCGASLEGAARPTPAEPVAAAARPSAPGGAGDDLAELLEAAREQAAAPVDDGAARVSQDDIDSLFGD